MYTKKEKILKSYMEKGYVNILSLTGGGIYGLAQALILDQIDNIDKFDILAGTSVGGINALLIAHGEAGSMSKFYDKYAKSIFNTKNVFSLAMSGLPLIKNKNIETPLKIAFTSKLFGDTKCPVFVPSYNIEQGKPKFFWSENERDAKVLSWKIARATSAAPTYFSPIDVYGNGIDYADGGVFCNDPVVCVCTQINKEYDIPFSAMRVCGIGTGLIDDELLKRPSNPSRYYKWLKIIIGDITRGNSLMHRHVARQLLNPREYLHVDFPQLDYSFVDPKVYNVIKKEWRYQINTYITAINNF